MKIGFHIYEFSFRGTEVATYDYALYNTLICGNISVIFCPEKISILDSYNKFSEKFEIKKYKDIPDLERICILEKINGFYILKYGKNDNVFLKSIPTFIHCVFTTNEEHGHFYCGVSNSVSIHNSKNKKYDVLNHIVCLPELNTDYREQLNIPKNHIVLGRHGGKDTFDIPYVKECIEIILNEREDIWFIFCTRPYILENFNHERVIYLESFTDNKIKRKLINTCDCMLHASSLGESFGLSILEFSYCDKPVITWNGGTWHKQHLENLGNKAILYNDKNNLLHILKNFKNIQNNYKELTIDFSPKKIMKDFENLFLNKLKKL